MDEIAVKRSSCTREETTTSCNGPAFSSSISCAVPPRRVTCPRSFRDLRVGDYANHPGDAEGEVLEDVRLGGVREGGHDRRAEVRLLSDPSLEGNLAEKVDVQHARDSPSSAGREDIGLFAAMRAEEVTHVLDDAEDGHVELPEHR